MPAAAVIGGATLVSGVMGANAARSAADQQSAAADRAAALQKQQYDEGVARSKPFYDTSVKANSKLSSLLGLDGSDPSMVMQNDPGYQFRMGEGQKAIENSAAARGSLLSGGALKALQRSGQDYASGEFDKVYNRFSNTAGGGQVASNMNASGANYANNWGNTTMSGAAASAAGTMGASNALSGALSQGVNNYQQNQMMGLFSKRNGINY